ncbi:hypothetical protein AMTRI_Chr09g18020 [Amborella trichopoda]
MEFFTIMYKIDILDRFIFIARYGGSRRVILEPTASLLMTEMSQYQILGFRSWYSKFFSCSPIPILGRIVANKYSQGIYEKIIRIEPEMGRVIPCRFRVDFDTTKTRLSAISY